MTRNLQGDVVKVLDLDGNVVAWYTYCAWGNKLDYGGLLAYVNPITYRGYYFDWATGLYYLQLRYYDPMLRRFISADALFDTGVGILGTNMYIYANNDPVNFIDPTGFSSERIGFLIQGIGNRLLANDGLTYLPFGSSYAQNHLWDTWNLLNDLLDATDEAEHVEGLTMLYDMLAANPDVGTQEFNDMLIRGQNGELTAEDGRRLLGDAFAQGTGWRHGFLESAFVGVATAGVSFGVGLVVAKITKNPNLAISAEQAVMSGIQAALMWMLVG